MEKKKSFWLSFDLGLKGDYDGLYSFLDTVGAIECVNNLAYFKYECLTTDYATEIQRILAEKINIDKSDRIYIIWRSELGSIKGKFLFGNRKRSPWEGFGNILAEEESEVAE